jgi:hypothetical protein
MSLDTTTGNIAGSVPYQSRVSKTYTFTMQAVDFPISLADLNYTLLGNWSNSISYLENQAVRYNGIIYVCLQKNENQLPNAVGSVFWQSTVATAEKTFTIEIIGEIDSAIEWDVDADLGTIKPNQASTKAVRATSLLYGGRTVYEQVDGELPPGLNLLGTGDLVGKVKQFGDANGPGLTRFFDKFISVSNITGTFNDHDIITGTDSGTVAKIIRVDLENNRLYYDYVSPTATVDFINGELVFSSSTTANVGEKNRYQDGGFDDNETTTDKVFKFKIKARDTANFSELIIVSKIEINFQKLQEIVSYDENYNKFCEWLKKCSDTEFNEMFQKAYKKSINNKSILENYLNSDKEKEINLLINI